MRVTVDPDACVGHGRCYALAAEVFDADDHGHVVIVLGSAEGDADVPAGLEERVRVAVANCPEGALAIVEP